MLWHCHKGYHFWWSTDKRSEALPCQLSESLIMGAAMIPGTTSPLHTLTSSITLGGNKLPTSNLARAGTRQAPMASALRESDQCLKTPPGVSVVLSCRWKRKMLRYEEAVLMKALEAPRLVQRGWGVCKKTGLCQEAAQEQSDAGRNRQLPPGAWGLQPCNQVATRTWAFFALQEGRVQGSQLQSSPKESSCRHPRQ